jgi:hypothetical protein
VAEAVCGDPKYLGGDDDVPNDFEGVEKVL